jgi:AcrR family transcriptional regulator
MSRSTLRRQEEKEQRRETIIDAAEVVFAHAGFAAAKMEDVAKQARVSRALVYLYFKNKEELQFAICARALSLLHVRFSAAVTTASTGYAQILAIGRSYVQFAKESPTHFMALSHFETHRPEQMEPGSVEREVLEAGKQVHGVTIAALRQGQRDGSIRKNLGNPMFAALSLWSFCHGTIQIAMTKVHFLNDVGVAVDDFIEHALALALGGLKAPATPAKKTTPRSRRSPP